MRIIFIQTAVAHTIAILRRRSTVLSVLAFLHCITLAALPAAGQSDERNKAPEDIVYLEEMPLNATGKVDRVTLKRMAEKLHEN